MKQAGIYVSVAVVVLAVAAGVLLSPRSATTSHSIAALSPAPPATAASGSSSTTSPNAAGPTRARSGVTCPPSNNDDCTVTASTPGSGGSGDPGRHGGGGDITCYDWNRHVVACYNPDLGWNNPTDHCFYRVADPPPPVSDPAWEGHRPPDGTVYTVYCRPGNGGQRQQWLPVPPPGFGGRVPQFDLAATAINSMRLRGPTIRSAPAPDGAGLVGLPVWLWTPSNASTWGPNTKSASVPGLTVAATAQAESITWSMGDGHRVTCRSVGTPYTAAAGGARSPTCGYAYLTPSRDRPDGRFHIRGTTTWHITWHGGGLSGELDIQKYTDSTVLINELEVVTS